MEIHLFRTSSSMMVREMTQPKAKSRWIFKTICWHMGELAASLSRARKQWKVLLDTTVLSAGESAIRRRWLDTTNKRYLFAIRKICWKNKNIFRVVTLALFVCTTRIKPLFRDHSSLSIRMNTVVHTKTLLSAVFFFKKTLARSPWGQNRPITVCVFFFFAGATSAASATFIVIVNALPRGRCVDFASIVDRHMLRVRLDDAIGSVRSGLLCLALQTATTPTSVIWSERNTPSQQKCIEHILHAKFR